jgi:hypothetical protein
LEAEQESKGLDSLLMLPPTVTQQLKFLVLSIYE